MSHFDGYLAHRGDARLDQGSVVIEFSYTDEHGEIRHVPLDVDAFAPELARDLLVAICHQRDSEGVA